MRSPQNSALIPYSSPIFVFHWKMSSSCRMLNTKEIKVANRYTWGSRGVAVVRVTDRR